MHQQSNVVGIQARKPTFTTKVFDDYLHKWSKLVLQEFEGEHSLQFSMVFRLDERLIILPVNILSFVPSFTYIWNACSLWNNSRWQSEGNSRRFTSLLSRCVTNNLANSWWNLTLSTISQKQKHDWCLKHEMASGQERNSLKLMGSSLIIFAPLWGFFCCKFLSLELSLRVSSFASYSLSLSIGFDDCEY